MPPPDAPKDPRLLKQTRGALSDDGRVFLLTFTRTDGSEHEVIIPFDTLADLTGLLEGTSAEAIKRQEATLHGQDRRAFYPVKKRKLTKIGGGVTPDGLPILTLGIDKNLQMDFALPLAQIPELISWLRRLEQDARSRSKRRTN